MLFSKSGLGKTSLLQAGLFPRLRRQHLLPVLVRLNHDADAPSALDQIHVRLVEECAAHRLTPPGEATVTPPPAALTESLWSALHTPPLTARDADGTAWQPIFVLDQFEEIFTLGAQNVERQRRWFGNLGDLIENRIPAAVEAAIGADEDLLDRLQLDAQPYRVLLSLREDYLPDLERWCDLIPRLGPNRYRLLPMREEQALDATLQTGGRLLTADDAEHIVRFVASQQEGALAAIEGPLPRAPQIEPALLSLVCSGLNAERQANGAAQIDASNLEQIGGRIIESFYDKALAGIAPELTAFLESELITPDGIRLTYPLKSILQRPGIGKADLDKLIDRRLLRKEAFVDGDRIEVVHDRLAAVALQRRHHREQMAAEQRLREEAERAEVLAQAQQKRAEAEAAARRQAEESGARLRRMQRWLWGAVVGLVVLLGVAGWEWWNAERQAGIAQRQTEVAEERQRETLVQKANADTATRKAEEQRQIADERLAEVEEKQSQLLDEQQKTKAALAQAKRESEKARQANRQAETNLGQAKAAEGRAFASLREATILRLAAEGLAIIRGSRTGGSLRGLLTVLAAHRLSAPDNPRTSAAAFGAMQGEDLRFARMNYLREHSGRVTSVAFSPDGRRIVSGSRNGTLRLWDAATGEPIGQPIKGTEPVSSIAFSPDGQHIVSGSSDSTLRLWDAATGEPIGEPLKEHTSSVRSVAFSPDGRRIISGSNDETLRLWDATTGAPIGEPLKGHTEGVSSVAFSPDGRRIVSGSRDGTVRIWPVLESWADALCAKLPRNMSRKEWKAWVGAGIEYACQCPGLPVPPDDDPLSTHPAALCPTPWQPQPVATVATVTPRRAP